MDTKVDEALVEARRILHQAALCDSAPVIGVLIAEVERLRQAEAALRIAAKEFVEIEETYGMLEMDRWDDAFDALRKALEASNG